MSAPVRKNVRETFNVGTFLSKRSDDTVSIRKQKREEGFLKRRSVMPSADATHGVAVAVAVTQSPQLSPQPDTALPPSIHQSDMGSESMMEQSVAASPANTLSIPASAHISQIPQLSADIRSPIESVRLAAVNAIRRLLSQGLLRVFFQCISNTVHLNFVVIFV